MTQDEQIAAFRSPHKIEPVNQTRDIVVCRHDGVRVFRIKDKNKTYRHDIGAAGRLTGRGS